VLGLIRRHRKRVLLVAPTVLATAATACGGSSTTADGPAVVERVGATDLYCITLSAEAVRRLDVRTAVVRQTADGTVIPYSAMFYSTTGKTWTYVNVKPRTFMRAAIVVDRIEGERAALSAGPTAGTGIAASGVAELHGIESGAQADASAGAYSSAAGRTQTVSAPSSCTG
jgi:hypothetical protein